MSVESSQPWKAKPKPPFYGPDGRYLPPAENGELPLHPPGHMELPGENVEGERQRADAANLRAEAAEKRAEEELRRADEAHQRAERLAAKLRDLGIDPDGD